MRGKSTIIGRQDLTSNRLRRCALSSLPHGRMLHVPAVLAKRKGSVVTQNYWILGPWGQRGGGTP